MASLIICSGELDGKWYAIRHKTLVLGRDEALLAQIVDPDISRKHAAVFYDKDKDAYFIKDMGSKNGTYVNNGKTEMDLRLQDDDLIRIGNTLLLFTHQDFKDENNALDYYKKVKIQREIPTSDQASPEIAEQIRKLKENAEL